MVSCCRAENVRGTGVCTCRDRNASGSIVATNGFGPDIEGVGFRMLSVVWSERKYVSAAARACKSSQWAKFITVYFLLPFKFCLEPVCKARGAGQCDTATGAMSMAP